MRVQTDVCFLPLPISPSPYLPFSTYGNSVAVGKYNRAATTTSSSSLGYGTNKQLIRSIAVGSDRWKKTTPVERS